VKNERLRKYEIKKRLVDIDIYVPKFSRLSVPAENLLANFTVIDGINVADVHYLLLLKLGAYRDRLGSAKGKKDAIDIVSLLFHCHVEKELLEKAAKGAGMPGAWTELRAIAAEFSDEMLPFIGADFLSFKRWRREFMKHG
jgi:hypothetical protein